MFIVTEISLTTTEFMVRPYLCSATQAATLAATPFRVDFGVGLILLALPCYAAIPHRGVSWPMPWDARAKFAWATVGVGLDLPSSNGGSSGGSSSSSSNSDAMGNELRRFMLSSRRAFGLGKKLVSHRGCPCCECGCPLVGQTCKWKYILKV